MSVGDPQHSQTNLSLDGGGLPTLKARRSPEGLKMVMAAGSCLLSWTASSQIQLQHTSVVSGH